MRRTGEFFRGIQLNSVDEGKEYPNKNKSGTSLARQRNAILNGVSLAGR